MAILVQKVEASGAIFKINHYRHLRRQSQRWKC
ncbi:hypothetical protein F441_02784 [Phytophthora nicotianae CJ01A1]|uniref:Uncharacterized protein n=3 Tax=Phytophthora nicotianae TaxID=4792 RepID=V9FVG0_PHYNI|nr:hypothetical protein F443_02795 [Phytophthora nicotianae P1569]ETK94216.1 hypothetical protein L915_02686 [Phytophthora nicotianae]ETK94220.1 hypothetical protein L915_02685 [Phytophthora nicotianae]ETM00696.1 hypothetical protein L917_02601 [Phytophthora nicotianae]ETP24177.1 hypothetical protein F441_02784 [Phytophthora nicotianae CJ01A1]